MSRMARNCAGCALGIANARGGVWWLIAGICLTAVFVNARTDLQKHLLAAVAFLSILLFWAVGTRLGWLPL